MKFFTTSLLLGLSAVSTLVTAVAGDLLPAGNYYILNWAPAATDLAITFNGEGNTLTVAPFSRANNQTWTVKDYDADTQSISPVSAPNLQAAWGDGVINVKPAGNYVWRINFNETGESIQDGGATAFWGIDKPIAGENVTIKPDNGGGEQRWYFAEVN